MCQQEPDHESLECARRVRILGDRKRQLGAESLSLGCRREPARHDSRSLADLRVGCERLRHRRLQTCKLARGAREEFIEGLHSLRGLD